MDVLMRLKPKVKPYIIMICILAILVIISALSLSVAFPEYSYPILLVGLLAVAVLALAILQQFYRRVYTTYDISESDLISRFGVFAPDEHVIPIDEITDVHVDRSVFGIILGLGDINIDTPSAEKGYAISMKDIDAAELNKAVELLRNLVKQRKSGSRTESGPGSKTQ